MGAAGLLFVLSTWLAGCQAFLGARSGSLQHRAWRRHQSCSLAMATNDKPIGKRFRVTGVEYREGRFANLKVFEDAGDPYGEVLSFLRHGDIIECTDYVVFAGQS